MIEIPCRWLAVVALLVLTTAAPAPHTLAQQQESTANPLPVRQVTVFTSGVAYTERAGEVEGDASVPLMFRTGQVNDILKSLVLLDEGGKVLPAVYGARDPIGHSLQSFAVDVSSNLTQEEILTRLRGAKVSVIPQGKPAVTGRIVGVEQRQVAGEDQKPINVPLLTLLSDDGLVPVRLDAGTSIKLLDERLDRELRDALDLLATGADQQRRQVTLRFAGAGRRRVRVGYVTEAPLWKMTYRLLVGGTGPAPVADSSYVQGWALVENTTDDDWRDVQLTLVSGRPISFIEDLYQPLYVPRPVVPPDVVASPVPQTHAGNLEAGKAVAQNRPQAGGAGTAKAGAGVAAPLPPAAESALGYNLDNSMIAAGGYGAGRMGEVLRASVAAQATGQAAGELFQYRVSTPVTLPRQQAAMIPVIAKDIRTEKVALYDASAVTHPLDAIRVTNTTGLHLKGGPVTLIDDGIYAGDARMEDIPPGDSRLVSYALDLTIDCERQQPRTTLTESALSLRKGVLTITRTETVETLYTLKSKAQKARTVLVEHPFLTDQKLVTPAKAAERTAGVYRFEVPLAPGKSETLRVVTERPISQTVAVLEADLSTLVYHVTRGGVSDKLQEALRQIVQRRRKVQELEAQAKARAAEVTSISADQDRIRKNMTALDRTSALYKRYVNELDQQETRIRALRKEADRLRRDADAANTDLRTFVDTLNIT